MTQDADQLKLRRIERFVRERLEPAVYRARHPLTVTAWDVPGEPVPFAHATAQAYRPFAVGQRWGAPWTTTWFHLTGSVPEQWQLGSDVLEIELDLGFNTAQPGFQAEGLAYRPDGSIIEGLSPRNRTIALDPASRIEVYLEAAGNPDVTGGTEFWAPTPYGVPEASDFGPMYTFAGADLAIRDLTVWHLLQDVVALRGIVAVLSPSSPRRAKVLHGLDRLVDAIDPGDVCGTAAIGRQVLAPLLAQPAHASAHQAYAVGHAHIDSAWLWPVRETVRKVARTFANVLARMDEDPDFVFAASSAQQYAWMQQHYPALFQRMLARIHEGRFIPVGSMWVESDTNMPGGEAVVRQLLHGKRYFAEQLGVETTEVWLPDSFGYSGALPQLARGAGADYFLTQKLCWNEIDKMPHHTFLWEGIDGSQVFTHFPPVETYNSDLSATELSYAESNFEDKAAASGSLVPFGHGDGGGGPTREMIAAAHRYADTEGVPSVRMTSPRAFFDDARAELTDPALWVGEMYLEYHRGTYSSQARTKRGNRRSEHLLREAELWCATAAIRTGAAYPYDQLEQIWRTVLLNQFHDILPGSSIGWVYRQAEAEYARIEEDLEAIIAHALNALGTGTTATLANACPYPRQGVAALGISPVQPSQQAARIVRDEGGITLVNDALRVHVLADGTIDSLIGADGREAITPGGRANLLQLARDTPKQWDAWDIDVEYRRHIIDLTEVAELAAFADDDGAHVRVHRRIGRSSITQTLTLRGEATDLAIATEVDWHERQQLLKLVFEVDVHADRSAAETQFGHVFRNTHANTSWDAAKFEICAHRWVHVGEPGFGVAIANDASYGHDIARTSDGCRTSTRVGVTLLRAPLFPDPEADQGAHRFVTRVRPSATIGDAVELGYRTNLPARTFMGTTPVAPLVAVTGPGVLIESVKLAEDRSGDVVVRLYEAHGARTTARLQVGFDHTAIVLTDLLERELAEQDAQPRSTAPGGGGHLEFTMRPFGVRTVRIRPVSDSATS
ncbi:MAG: alpha-mannosidase [Beutenbergiaceae bacterium]